MESKETVCCVDTVGGRSDVPYEEYMEEFVPNPCYSRARRHWFLGGPVGVPYQAGDGIIFVIKCKPSTGTT